MQEPDDTQNIVDPPGNELPKTSWQRNRRHVLVIGLLLFLNLALRLVVAWRPLQYIDGLAIPDDAYISLHLSRNIAAGLGPSYAGEYTNGFQPLYVFLMVPVFSALQNDLITPIRIALTLSCLIDTITLWLIFRMLRIWTSSLTVACALGAAWIFSPYVIVTTVNGLETAMASCIVVWGWWLYAKFSRPSEEEHRLGRWFILGLVLGLAILARIDAGLFLLAVALTHLIAERKDLQRTTKELLVMGGGALLANLPWLIYSFYYTGQLYPVSGRAVRFMSLAGVHFNTTFRDLYFPILNFGLLAVVERNRSTIAAIAGAAILLWIFRKKMATKRGWSVRVLLPGWIFALFIFEGYTLYIFGKWFFPRYLYPVCVVMIVSLGWALGRLSAVNVNRVGRAAAVLFVGLTCLIVNLFDPELPRLFNSTDDRELGYMNLGIWANNSFPPGTVLGALQSGAVGYFATKLSVVNLDGVVSKSCYDALVERKGMEFIRERKVQYILGWRINIRFLIQQSESYEPEDVTLLREIDGFRSWREPWFLLRVNY